MHGRSAARRNLTTAAHLVHIVESVVRAHAVHNQFRLCDEAEARDALRPREGARRDGAEHHRA